MSGPRTQTTATQSQNQQSQGQSSYQQRDENDQVFTGTNTYGLTPGPTSADIDALRAHRFTRNPATPYAFAHEAQRARDVYANPLGAYTTQGIRDASLMAGDEDRTQRLAQAQREDDFSFQGARYNQLSEVAARTAPQVAQLGQVGTTRGGVTTSGSQQNSGTQSGTSTGNSTSNTNPGTAGYISSGIAGASNVGAALL